MKFYICFIVDSSVPCFASFLDHAKPTKSEDEQNSPILTCTILSRITSEGTSLTDNKAWSHRTSKSWTSSCCKLILNKVESPCTASKLRLHDSTRRSCTQFVFLVGIGHVSEHAALRHFSSSEVHTRVKLLQCRRNHCSKHIAVRKITSLRYRSRCRKFLNIFRQSQLL